MLISVNSLRPADIIVRTTNAGISPVIRAGIGSSVSHSIIYIGGSTVVEAIAKGVVQQPLADYVTPSATSRRDLAPRTRFRSRSCRWTSALPIDLLETHMAIDISPRRIDLEFRSHVRRAIAFKHRSERARAYAAATGRWCSTKSRSLLTASSAYVRPSSSLNSTSNTPSSSRSTTVPT